MENTYKYRNLPCNIVENPWYVSGVDTLNNCGGILEWAHNEKDAQNMLDIMSEYSQFDRLSIAQF